MVVADARGLSDLPRAAGLLDEAVRSGQIASASAVVLVDGRVALAHTLGVARRDPWRPVQPSQVYDLASLTKPLATSTTAAALVAAGRLDVEAPVSTWFPEIDARVTVRHLLQHSSGLPAWAPLYRLAEGSHADRLRLKHAARQLPLVAAPGEKHIYSDIGFLVLLGVLEQVGGGLQAPTGLRWGDPEAAATERCPERGRVVEGVVHDLNAWAMGGRSSHAGLFGDAHTVARLVRALVRGDGAWSAVSAVLHRWWQEPSVGTHRGGWDRPSPEGYSSTGGVMPPDAVGHLGYTGCSVWASRARDTVIVLLTNRIHEVDELAAIKALRPAWHRAVAVDLGWPEPHP